jgi:phosphatidylserine decarboxylase
MKNDKTPIAVEGLPFIGVGMLLVAVFLVLGWHAATVVALVLTLFTVFFFRNPERTTPADERAVIAPADGVVIYLGPAVEEHTGQEMTKISIFMSVFNVHVNRAPITGTVVDSFYFSGKFLDVRHERATFENERQGLVFETAEAVRLVVVQVAGLIARRIVCYPGVGDTVKRGQRYGLIRFGSRLDVYLPTEATITVAMGDKTVAGETILGYLP